MGFSQIFGKFRCASSRYPSLPLVIFGCRGHCLISADDLKMIRQVSTVQHSIDFLCYLDFFFSWGQSNLLQLNVRKCKIVAYHCKRTSIEFDCHLNNISLERVCDLVIFYRCFVNHLKAYTTLGFMKRICTENLTI